MGWIVALGVVAGALAGVFVAVVVFMYLVKKVFGRD